MNEFQEIARQIDELKKRVDDLYQIVERLDIFKAGTDPAYKQFCQNVKGA